MSDPSALDRRLNDLAARVDAATRALLEPSDPAFRGLFAMVAYHLGFADERGRPLERPVAGGKKLRSALCLLVAGACSGDPEAALDAAVALDLVHNFSLVHDDVQDGSAFRRNRPTVWSLWGVPQAINVGDALYALAHRAITRDAARAPAAQVEAVRLLNEACLRLVEGQYLDLALQRQAAVSLAEYEAMVSRKTGALFACAARLGALFGGAAPERQRAWERFGLELGIVFQLQDDLLGVWGEPAVTGKPAGADVRSRKKALPAVLALAAEGPAAAEVRAFYRATDEPCDADVARIIARFAELGVRRQAEALVGERFAAARRLLDALRPGRGPDLELLAALLDRMEARQA